MFLFFSSSEEATDNDKDNNERQEVDEKII